MGLREDDQRRADGKAMSFRAQGRVQPYPARAAGGPVPSAPGSLALDSSSIAHSAQRKEDSMNYHDTTSLIDALAGLVAALAGLVMAIRRSPCSGAKRLRLPSKARRTRR